MAYEVASLVYGRHPVLETLRAEVPVRRLLLAEGIRSTGPIREIRRRAQDRGATIQYVPRKTLDQAVRARHQGVVAEVAPYEYAEFTTLLGENRTGHPPLVLLLDCLQDVQNFGVLLRSAEAVGVHGVIIPKRRSVTVTPAVYRTSAGAVHYLKIARVPNLVGAIKELQRAGLWVVGLDASGETRFDQANLRGPLALVVGSEGKGLGRLVRERCDLRVKLPMAGRVHSLNAAVAGSVILYEVWRQRQLT